jgi:hypothetical protein
MPRDAVRLANGLRRRAAFRNETFRNGPESFKRLGELANRRGGSSASCQLRLVGEFESKLPSDGLMSTGLRRIGRLEGLERGLLTHWLADCCCGVEAVG